MSVTFLTNEDKAELEEKIDNKYPSEDIGGSVPEVTVEDNGKFLRVVNGVWAAVIVPIYNGEVEDV